MNISGAHYLVLLHVRSHCGMSKPVDKVESCSRVPRPSKVIITWNTTLFFLTIYGNIDSNRRFFQYQGDKFNLFGKSFCQKRMESRWLSHPEKKLPQFQFFWKIILVRKEWSHPDKSFPESRKVRKEWTDPDTSRLPLAPLSGWRRWWRRCWVASCNRSLMYLILFNLDIT